MKNLKYFGMAALAALVLTSCEKETDTMDSTPDTNLKGSFTLEFEHRFEGSNLILGNTYTNSSDEELIFDNVKYYISNITLTKADGTVWAEEESYHLVDASNLSSLEIDLENVPSGEYITVNYMIGVDSVRNVSGAQDGALSPNNNMFWSWNSGYIFAKVEGTSSASTTGVFSYHLGGFAGENAAQVQKSFDVSGQILKINPDTSPQVHMLVNLKTVFDGMHTISVATMPTLRMPGEMAMHFSHNLGAGFTLDHIHE